MELGNKRFSRCRRGRFPHCSAAMKITPCAELSLVSREFSQGARGGAFPLHPKSTESTWEHRII